METPAPRQNQAGARCCGNGDRGRDVHAQCKFCAHLRARSQTLTECLLLGTHLSAQKLQVEIAAAQKADQRELVARLDGLANNDRKILAALQADSRGRRRLEELILALDKVGLSMMIGGGASTHILGPAREGHYSHSR